MWSDVHWTLTGPEHPSGGPYGALRRSETLTNPELKYWFPVWHFFVMDLDIVTVEFRQETKYMTIKSVGILKGKILWLFPRTTHTLFNIVFFKVSLFFRESWCISKIVFSMVFHLQKVSSKNSNTIKSYGCFKTGYKWRHLLPVYLVSEGFHEITAVSRVYMAKIQKQLGQKRQSNQRRQKSSLGLIWG